MSYILEALKKSQAERQLGELPSIHAPQVQLHPAPAAGGARRLPLWLGLGAACIGAIGLWLWQPWQPRQAAVPVAAPLAATVPAPVAAVAPAPTPVLAAPVAVPAPAPVVAAAPAPVVARPVPAPVSVPAPAPVQPAPVAKAAPVPAAPVPAAAAVEEVIPGLRDLPEPIQRQIPAIALGGYIYSKDPADRLLLIDKVLRHEGEEVAPGLVLDKLQPKAAIFSFRGYRYRVPY